MRTETHPLTSVSPGTSRTLTRHVWGAAGQGPKVYLQAALHADEMPGPLALFHLMQRLDDAEAQGRITGHIVVVPMANPIGLSQWIAHKPMGRQDLESMRNYNRGYPDLAALAGDALESQLTTDPAQNLHIIRAAFATALAALTPDTELDELRIALLHASHDADYVLDLHCDHRAMMHLYASNARPSDTDLLARCTGAKLALVEDISGGNAFDEAHTAPWHALRQRYGDRFPIPAGCFSTTLEYRGQADVSDALAAADADGLLAFLASVKAVTGGPIPAHPTAPTYPLAGALEFIAPIGGIVSWITAPGDMVTKGQILGHITDPTLRRRTDITAPTTGLLYRQELWPACLKGQGLCHVAGHELQRQGDLLSD